jgi:hypothetical protein
MEVGKFLGAGERSKVYQHPNDSAKVIKVTSAKSEKEVITAFYEEPESYFVKIHSIEKKGSVLYAVLDKVENADFKFTLKERGKNGETHFFEGKFDYFNYINTVCRGSKTHAEYVTEVKQKVTQPELVEQYYAVITAAYSQGCCMFDTAWNLGFFNGKLVCFDTSFRK